MLKNIKLSEIAIVESRNYSRGHDWFANVADAATLAVLLKDGWEAGLGVAVLTKASPNAGEQHKCVILDMVRDELEVKLNAKDKVAILPADVYAEAWAFDKSEPRYELVSAFRRLSVMPLVNAIRVRQGFKPITEIPCEVQEFDDLPTRIAKCFLENTAKTSGSRRVVDSDLLDGALAIFENGGKEVHLTKGGLKRGTSQKLWSICRANRLLQDNGEPSLIEEIKRGNVEYGPLDAGKLRSACEAQSVQGVKLHLEESREGRKNETKAMSKKDIEALAMQTGCKPLAHILRAVLNNDSASLRVYAEQKAAYNALFESIEANGK